MGAVLGVGFDMGSVKDRGVFSPVMAESVADSYADCFGLLYVWGCL